MSENKLAYNQASKYSAAIAEVFYEVMETKKPADRELRNYFSRNKQCGSKDRRFISEGLYALFRWYGWSRKLIPVDKSEVTIEDKDFIKALTISLNIEGLTNPLAYKALCEICTYDSQELSSDLEALSGQVGELIGEELVLEDLVPSWFLSVTSDLDKVFFEALQKRPPVWIRTQRNALKEVLDELSRNDVDFEVSEKIPNAVKVISKANLVSYKSFRDGLFEIQDLASQCLVSVCQVGVGQNWWDVCAGGGGKTLAIADQLKGKGKVVATDKRKEVIQEVKKRANRGKFGNVRLANLHKEKLSREEYDGVLVDAPCSCTGTWRRNPDARWTRSEKVCQEWAGVQCQILTEVKHKVKAGGTLVYATCSSSFVENEQVVEKFLAENPGFELEAIVHPLTGQKTNGMVFVEALPEDCDCMFAARMIRKKK